MVVRILLVEKDVTTADLLIPSLERKGFQVTLARNRRQALRGRQSFRPDILVIDVTSFGATGYDMVNAVQSRLGNLPTILLLEEGHAIAGSQAAAFMTPPFTSRKLLYRLRKVAETLPLRELRAGDLVLDPLACTLQKGQSRIRLRPKEASLLAFFMRHPGQVLSRNEIMSEVWDTDYMDDTRTLNVHIRWLRLKIEDNPSKPRMVRTVRGVGYTFRVRDAS
jgi:DNA-binding response OmpR family regulator